VTKVFKSIHPPKTLEKALSDEQVVGVIDVDEARKLGGGKDEEDTRIEHARASLRNVETVRRTLCGLLAEDLTLTS
jgi:L-lactate dehydrogenase (cytochrome)